MTTDHNQQARELLAAEYAREGITGGVMPELFQADAAALRAIEAALAQSACCMCGTAVDTRENGTPGAQLTDGRWTCSPECWEKATQQAGAVPEGWVLVLDGLSDALRMHREARTTYKSLESSVDDAIRSLRAMLAAAPPVPSGGWLPIETAPHTGIAVLLWQPWKSGRNPTVIGHYANGWCWGDNEEMQPEPTHWQPLPPAPSGGRQG